MDAPHQTERGSRIRFSLDTVDYVFIGVLGMLIGSVFVLAVSLPSKSETETVASEAERLYELYDFLTARPVTRRTQGWLGTFASHTNLTEYLPFNRVTHHTNLIDFLPLSSTPGQLMFEPDPRAAWLFEGMPHEEFIRSSDSEGFDDHRFFFLGYCVAGNRDVEHFARAYRIYIGSGKPLPQDLPLGDWTTLDVTAGMQTREIRGIRAWMFHPTCGMWHEHERRGDIPILIERPEFHDPPGSHVVYLGGRVEYIPYPGKWPMTEKTIGLLRDLDALGDA